MVEPLKLLCVFAHPDDESMGAGGILIKYSLEGVQSFLLCATRGERGWPADPQTNPGMAVLGQMREAELFCAAEALGISQVDFLDYLDGDLDQAPPGKIIPEITAYIRKVRPQVVITMPPDGIYGHPDHIAISAFTSAAVMCAADAGYPGMDGLLPHRVSKLYYMVEHEDIVDAFCRHLGQEFSMEVDGVVRKFSGWKDWMVTAQIDASPYWEQVREAINCHRTQLQGDNAWLVEMSDEMHALTWSRQSYYRVFSLVNGGREVETDLFAGLR